MGRSVSDRRKALRELAALFLRLGCTAFGGPAAHTALLDREVVAKRGWLTRERFVELIGLTQLIPGPNSTELAMHVGMERAGVPGLLVAGLSFIAPSALLVTGLAWAYVRGAALPAAASALQIITPVILAIIAQAVVAFGRSTLTTSNRQALAVFALALAIGGMPELVTLAICAGVSVRMLAGPVKRETAAWFGIGALQAAAPVATVATVTMGGLFLSFLKIGSVLFGSGYVLIAFLQAEFVTKLHWLTQQQLLDAIAAGQITPGPLFTSATFIGYVLGGGVGAFVATVGIFLPAFVLVGVSGRLLPLLVRYPGFRAALDGLTVASLALMAFVTVRLGVGAILTWWQGALAAGAALLLWRKVDPTWLLLAAVAAAFARASL
jgi:chromate transporter